MKKILTSVLLAALVLALVGCGAGKMPFNGPIQFHDITVTIPSDFVRDSGQSNDNMRVFEKGMYQEQIIIMRNAQTDEELLTLESYAAFMAEQGAESVLTTFLDRNAVHSTYTKNDIFCQEMLFIYNGSIYAVALQGGTQEDFQALLDTVALLEQ